MGIKKKRCNLCKNKNSSSYDNKNMIQQDIVSLTSLALRNCKMASEYFFILVNIIPCNNNASILFGSIKQAYKKKFLNRIIFFFFF